jgi:uncharacterized protein (DUF885 family)
VDAHHRKAQPILGMETLSLHEAAPCHHFRIAIQQALTDPPRFEVREFHGEVLRDGALPMAVLEARIDRWITARARTSDRK